LSSVDAEARRLEQEELILREAEAQLEQVNISGELGESMRTSEGDDSGEAASGISTKKAKAKPSSSAPKIK
jgi:general secretion pathway protein D